MKTFILSVSKYKKWIMLGLSILSLVLFFFPLNNVKIKNGVGVGYLPFIIWIPHFISQLPSLQIPQRHISEQINVALFVIYTVVLIAFFVLAIIAIIRNFKGKRFKFTWSLACAVLVMFLRGISFTMTDDYTSNACKVTANFCFTFYIFLILLILDVVYLILEKHYLKPTDSGQ